MSELQGQGGELRATVTITRGATGKVEIYDLVASTTPEQHAQIVKDIEKERDDGRNP